jgi:HUS1 checkpoint protein
MRFRAKLLDISCITHLSRVVATLARNVKTSVLRLCPDRVCFVIVERGPVGGSNIWCELTQSNIFDEYRIEGKDERNEIYLELSLEHLSRALRTSLNAQVVKIKLTKRQGACLSVEIVQPTLTGASRTVTHEVPVSVVPERLWPDYQEPHMPDIDVSIYLPPLKLLKNITDRMKTMSNYVTVAANMSGELQLKMEADDVSATTFFRDLQNHVFDASTAGDESRDNSAMYEARIDIRKLGQFLQGQQFNPTKVICNITDGKGLQIFLLHEDVSLQYYIPAVAR